jgi:prevent-host-death family protein
MGAKRKVGVGMEVGVRELRRHLSKWLALVRQGAEVVITDRGGPIARLVGISTGGIDRSVAAGEIQLPTKARRPS